MTITLTFEPDVVPALLANAKANGMALEEYLQSIVEEQVLQLPKGTSDS
jgi:hypothetical protein